MLRQLIILLCATSIFCQKTSQTDSDVNNLAKTSSAAFASEEPKKNVTSQSGFVPLSRTNISSIDDRAYSFSENSFQEVRGPSTAYLPAELPLEYSSADINALAAPAPVEPVTVEDASSSTSIITSGQSSGQSTAYSASVVSGPIDSQTGAANTQNPEKPYNAVPNTRTITSQEAFGQSSSTYASHQVGPIKTETNSASSGQQDTIPSTTDTVTINTHKDANKQSSAKSAYPVHNYQTVINPPTIQYIHSPKVTYAVNPVSHVPVGSKTVTVETFNSVAALPALRYTPAPTFVRYGPTPVPVIDPIPVPVLYENSGVETFHHSASQFAVESERIPVPVISESAVRYNSVPHHVVHAKSFLENVYTPVGSHYHTIDHSAHRYEGYARALSYSPASSVSSVSFSGLGVNYGW